ncbi:MAG TPA: hypothetical protein DDW90_03105 [Cyanobacteria bacterium UBA9971]|nr:hypothetical protein [Cyanobacteria bacterium UBA9971]
MRLFLSFLSWFFGIIFLEGAILYFWCGEFFLGLWSLVVVIILIPPLYKYVSGRFNFSWSKTKIMIFSLIIFSALFANFVRPVYDGTFHITEWLEKDFKSQHEEVNSDIDKIIKINEIKKGDNKKTKCTKALNIVQGGEMFIEKNKKLLYEDEKSKEFPNIVKLYFIIGIRTLLPIEEDTLRLQIKELKKTMKTKLKCDNI